MNKHQKTVIFAMSIGIFLCMLDTTIMNIALPAIQSGLNVSLDNLSWALNIYTIVFAVFTIPFGRFADLYGRNKIYVLGLIVFGIGSIISGLSGNAVFLILGRGIQSVGASVVFPASMTIGISQASVEKRTQAILILGVTQGLAAALGPTIGGIVTQYLGWRWVFLVNVPILLIALILCLTELDFQGEKKVNAKLDLSGSMMSMLFLFALTLALIKGRDWGWHSLSITGLFAISILSFVVFIYHEHKTDSPMINMKLFRYRQFNGSSLTAILSQLFLVAVMVIMPTFLTRIQNETELTAAMLVTPISFMIFVCAPIAGLLVHKLGAKFTIFIGFLAMALACYSFYHLDVSRNYWQLILTCMLLGIGYGIIVGPITVLAASDFQGELLTASQSVIGVLKQLGSVLAVAIFVSGLTGNIGQAELASVQYAKKQIETLDVSETDRQAAINKAVDSIDQERSESNNSAISQAKERSMITAAYHQVLAQKHINERELPDPEKKAMTASVTQSVKQRVNQINDDVKYKSTLIQNKTKANMKEAFLSLYGWAFPFALASCFIAFLFKGKARGFVHEKRRRHSGNYQ